MKRAGLILLLVACGRTPVTELNPGGTSAELPSALDGCRRPQPLWERQTNHGALHALALGADSIAVAGADGAVSLWQLQTPRRAWRVTPPGNTALVMRDADLVTGGGQTLQRLRLTDGAALATAHFETADGVPSLRALGLLGQRIVSGFAWERPWYGNNVGVWNGVSATVEPVSAYIENSYYSGPETVTAVAASADGRFLATGGAWSGSTFELWRVKRQAPVPRDYFLYRDAEGTVSALAFAPQEQALWALRTGGGPSRLSRFEFQERNDDNFFEECIAETASLDGAAVDFAVTPSGLTLALADGAGVTLRDAQTLALRATVAVSNLTKVAVAPDGAHLVTAGSDGLLRVFSCDALQ